MKALSTFLLLLSSANFRIASGAKIREGSGVEDKTLQEHSTHDLAAADEHLNASADIMEDHNPHVELIAKEHNLSIEDAKKVREVERDFERLVEDLFDDINFLQAEIPKELDGPFVLKFKNGKVPEEGQDGIEKFMAKNENAKLEIVHSRLSLDEAEERGDRLLAKLESKGHPKVDYAIDGDDLEVWAAKPNAHRSLGEAEGEDIGMMSFSRTAEILDLDHDHRDLEGLELHLYEHRDEDPVNTHQEEDAADSTHARPDARLLRGKCHAHGGAKLFNRNIEGTCTSGFVVRSISGKCGVVTAGHCAQRRVWFQNLESGPRDNCDIRVAIIEENHLDEVDPWPYPNPSIDTDGEFAWYAFSKPHKATNLFFDAYGDLKSVGRTANGITKNQSVCGYSRTKDRSVCGRVKNTSGSSKPDMQLGDVHPIKKAVVVELPEDIVKKYGYFFERGDSGGPWWSDCDDVSCDAEGVSGGIWDRCEKKDAKDRCVFFSRVKFIERKLGVEVVTSPDTECA